MWQPDFSPLPRALIVACLAVQFLGACSTKPRDFVDPRPIPTAEQRAAFGTIVVTAGSATEPRLPAAPDSKSHIEKAGISMAAGGAGAGAGAIMGLGCGPFVPLCVPAFAVAGGVAGLAVGLANTMTYRTAEQVSAAEVTLRNALLSTRMEEQLVERIHAGATPTSGQVTRPLQHVVSQVQSDVTDFRGELAAQTEIRISVPKIAMVPLNYGQGRNPDIRMEIEVEGLIFQSGESTPAFERRWLYDSEVRGYFSWAARQGARVQEELDQAIETLSAQILSDFLGANAEAPSDQSVQTETAGQAAGSTGTGPASAGESQGPHDRSLLSSVGGFLKSMVTADSTVPEGSEP